MFKTSNKRKFGEIDKPLTLIPFNSLETEIKVDSTHDNYRNENGNINSNGFNTFSPGKYIITNGNHNSNYSTNINNHKNTNSLTSNPSEYNY